MIGAHSRAEGLGFCDDQANLLSLEGQIDFSDVEGLPATLDGSAPGGGF